MDLSRREFMFVGTTSLLSLNGGVSQQVNPTSETDEYEYSGVADLIGPEAALPEPGGEFFEPQDQQGTKIAFAYRYEATDTGNRYFIQDSDSKWTDISMGDTIDGHLSTANHTHIHRHIDELYKSGSEGVITGVADATQDWVIENPTDSGNLVEIIQYKVTASIGYETEQWYNVDFPTTGTVITPWPEGEDKTVTIQANVRRGGSIIDIATADRQLPGAVVGGAKQNPTPFEVTGADTILNPGETLAFRTILDSTNEDISYLAHIAEYEIDSTPVERYNA